MQSIKIQKARKTGFIFQIIIFSGSDEIIPLQITNLKNAQISWY